MNLSYNALINSFQDTKKNTSITIPENWMQGRTTYGGLSAALCLEAVYRKHSNLPPIRSAHIHFIGPVNDTVILETRILRQGKSVCFIEVEMKKNQEVLTHAMFCFGKARESKINKVFNSTPNYRSIDDSEDLFDKSSGPVFAQYFDCRLAKGKGPMLGSNKHEHLMWAKLKEDTQANPVLLLAIGDMTPPAIMPMFQNMAPTSSINWAVNFIQHQPKTKENWWLLGSYAEDAQEGYSSQNMQLWNDAGELVMTSRQSVAYFY